MAGGGRAHLEEHQSAERGAGQWYQVILWTNRVGEPLEKAVGFCKEHDIHLDAVNENLPEIVEAFGGDCRKVFANEYWDDRAVLMDEEENRWASQEVEMACQREKRLRRIRMTGTMAWPATRAL